jgi:hypothetical protein
MTFHPCRHFLSSLFCCFFLLPSQSPHPSHFSDWTFGMSSRLVSSRGSRWKSNKGWKLSSGPINNSGRVVEIRFSVSSGWTRTGQPLGHNAVVVNPMDQSNRSSQLRSPSGGASTMYTRARSINSASGLLSPRICVLAPLSADAGSKAGQGL